MSQTEPLLYNCNTLYFTPAKEGTIILNNPDKTLLCTQTINIDWDIPNVLKFSTLLCCIMESKKIQVEYTISIEKKTAEKSEVFETDFIVCKNLSYITFAIECLSRDKNGVDIIFKKGDTAIITIYGSSINDSQNKLITSPKLLDAVFSSYVQ
jgi:hypothetical protein